MDKILEAFSGAVLQSVAQVLDKLDENGKSYEEFRVWIADKVKEGKPLSRSVVRRGGLIRRGRGAAGKYYKRCPDCGNAMQLWPVNRDPKGADKIGTTAHENTEGRKYKSMWLCGTSCSKTGCWYEEYNYYSVEEFMGGAR